MKQSRSIRLCLTQCWAIMSMWQCSHLVLPSEKDVCKSSWLKRTGSTLLLKRRLTPTMDWKQTLLDSDQSVEKLWTAYQETHISTNKYNIILEVQHDDYHFWGNFASQTLKLMTARGAACFLTLAERPKRQTSTLAPSYRKEKQRPQIPTPPRAVASR